MSWSGAGGGGRSAEDLEDDLDEESEAETEKIVDLASASRNVDELTKEVESLRRLEGLAAAVRESRLDKKWDQLRNVLEYPEMFDLAGNRRKLVIFTEHRDTLNYLAGRICDLLGRQDAVVEIHGSLLREDRRKAQTEFLNNPEVSVLVATDAAGEGVNLQRAHLMINYDLPWNPNRIEQRFGRIHRFGQRESCHLWNLVAHQTREGAVYQRLFEKLDEERLALGGKVFDVLGRAFTEVSLRELMLLDKALGQFGTLPMGDHPADDLATEDVEDDVEIEVGPLRRPQELGDLPAPELVGRLGQEFRLVVDGMDALVAPFSRLSVRSQDPIHAALGAQIGTFVEQGGVDLSRRSIAKALGVEHGQDGLDAAAGVAARAR